MPDLNKILEDAVENPILSGAAEDIGKDLVDALIRELTLIPDPTVKNQNVWSTRKEAAQAETIHRLKDRVRGIVTQAFGQMLAAGNPAAKAKLKDVKFGGEKITAGLEIDIGCKERHALADFAGGHVAIIMPEDLEDYFDSMGEVIPLKDQPDLPLGDTTDDETGPIDGADSEDGETEPGEAEPSPEDTELFVALNSQAVNVPIDEIVKWSSEQRESAWNWIEAVEGGGVSDLPAFLDGWMGEPRDVSAAGAENEPAPAEPEDKPLEDMLKTELVAEALLAAASIDEGDITEAQFQRKTKAGLIEYITYARGKLSEKAAELSDDDLPVSPDMGIEPQMLIGDLSTVLGLNVPIEDANEWSEPTRREIYDYLATIQGGALPEQIPNALGPYLSENE